MSLKEQLQAYYLDFLNNYLTIEKFAEHNNLTTEQAKNLIAVCASCHEEIVAFHKYMKDISEGTPVFIDNKDSQLH